MGWTVGGGIEWAVWNNWSVKADYNYYDFGTSSVALAGTFAGAPILFQASKFGNRFQ